MRSAPAMRMPQGLSAELAAIRRRTRRGVAASLVAHAALLLLLKLTAPDPATMEGLVEITWIEAAAPAPAPPPAPAHVNRESPDGKQSPARPAAEPERQRFVREMPRAETSPQPQRNTTSRDAVRERLASLTRPAADSRTQIAALLPGADVARPGLAAAPGAPDAEPSPRSMMRGESKRRSPAPAELVRASVVPANAMTALARLADEPALPAPPPTPAANTFPAREVLAGVSLSGPVADRALVEWRLPSYPEWAKSDAVEGSVRLRFVVRPDGGVKEDIMVERTSGYADFDRNATLALRGWRFEAMPGVTGDQWGSITLDYRLDSVH